MIKPFCALVASIAAAAVISTAYGEPVTFWFAGEVTEASSKSNALPSNTFVGTPFSGRITYEPTAVSMTASDGTTNSINYYFRETTGFSFLMQIGGHTVTNSNAFKNSQWSGNYGVHNGSGNRDRYYIEIGNNGLVTDGLVDTNSYVDIVLSDPTATAFSSAALPGKAPDLEAFANVRRFTWSSFAPDDKARFTVNGVITRITTDELVALNIRRTIPGTVQISWPTLLVGGQLQAAENASNPNWLEVPIPVVPIGMENTVTLLESGTALYRLKVR